MLHLGTDSSAAKSFVCRRGLGRMRHLQVRDLWLQKEVREGNVVVRKIPGDQNPADLMTKYLDQRKLEKLMAMTGMVVLSGRHPNAPQLTIVVAAVSRSSPLLALYLTNSSSIRTTPESGNVPPVPTARRISVPRPRSRSVLRSVEDASNAEHSGLPPPPLSIRT